MTLAPAGGQKIKFKKAWEILANNSILRKKPNNLEILGKWLDDGIDKQKLIDGISKSRSKQNLIDDIGNGKSKVHVQVLIKDYDNIPGIVKGRYANNSSLISDKVDLPSGWAPELDINQQTIQTFTGKIKPIELKPGDKIYRVSPLDKADRPYWTRSKPEKLGDVVGGTAVQPEWNNFEYIHEYIVPKGKSIRAWEGKTARQPISETFSSNYHLPGGDEQLFINYIIKQDPDFKSVIKSSKVEW